MYNKIKSTFLHILIIFSHISCSFLIENDNRTKKINNFEDKNHRRLDELYCSKSSLMKVSKNGNFHKKNINYTGSIADQVVQNYWYEMLVNPDYFNSHPKIQIFIKSGNQYRYFESENGTSNEHPNFLTSLNTFLKKENSKRTLTQIGNDVEKQLNAETSTSFSLSQFIKTNISDFTKDDSLKSHFLKGDDSLAPFESFVPLKVKNISLTKNNSGLFKSENSLQTYQVGSLKLKCNFDLNLFQNFTSSLLDSHQFNSYYFSRTIDKNTFYVVTISSSIAKPITIEPTTGLMASTPTKKPIPFCFNEEMKNNFLFALSAEGRDPAQHISHFIDYGFFEAENLTDLISHMKFTRHLFLKSPDRLLFESLKARPEQLAFFHTMNIPLYHMDKLGEMLLYGKFNSNNQHSFVIDERSGTKISCQN